MNRITLDDIVKDVLSDQEKYTTHEYLRLLRFAHRGLKELTFDILGSRKVDLLEVSSSLRIDLPSDYVDYTFIGLVGSNGKINPLGFRKDIPLVGTQNTQRQREEDIGYINGGIFGYGGGQNENGYYSPVIDEDNGQMILTSIAAGKFIYLEYISDGMTDTGDTVVHPYASEALISFVHWKDIQHKTNFSDSEKRSRRSEYYNDKKNARSRMKAFTKEEAIQQSRKGFKQAPKI